MDSKEVEDIIAYRLRRWLRSARKPADARAGARKIVEHIRLCGGKWTVSRTQKPPSTNL